MVKSRTAGYIQSRQWLLSNRNPTTDALENWQGPHIQKVSACVIVQTSFKTIKPHTQRLRASVCVREGKKDQGKSYVC